MSRKLLSKEEYMDYLHQQHSDLTTIIEKQGEVLTLMGKVLRKEMER